MMEAQVAQMQKPPLVMISGKNSLTMTHACAFIFQAPLAAGVSGCLFTLCFI